MNESIYSIRKDVVGRERKKPPGNGHNGILHSSWLRYIPQRFAERAAVPMHFIFGNRCRNSFGVLMYHRIAPHTPGVTVPTWNVTPERFRDQMRGLLARGFKPWPLRKAVEYHRQGLPIPRNTFVLTFDDGYESFWTAENIEDLSNVVQWRFRQSHSGYIDAVLSAGLVGALCLSLIVLIGMFNAAIQFRETNHICYGITLGMLLFGFVDALLESGIIGENFATLLTGCGIIQLACLNPRSKNDFRHKCFPDCD